MTTRMVTVLPSGAWLVSLACPHCGFMGGCSSRQEYAQTVIAAWQDHIAECRGGAL